MPMMRETMSRRLNRRIGLLSENCLLESLVTRALREHTEFTVCPGGDRGKEKSRTVELAGLLCLIMWALDSKGGIETCPFVVSQRKKETEFTQILSPPFRRDSFVEKVLWQSQPCPLLQIE